MRRYGWWAIALVLLALWGWRQGLPSAPAGPGAPAAPAAADPARWPGFLPPEALATLARIERGGPFDYRQDGSVFGNRERLLPSRPAGYYREYTVATPGAADRGARRIVSGGRPPVEYFYSDDHYRSFRRFTPRRGSPR